MKSPKNLKIKKIKFRHRFSSYYVTQCVTFPLSQGTVSLRTLSQLFGDGSFPLIACHVSPLVNFFLLPYSHI